MELLLDKEPVYLSETVYDGQTEQGIELDYVLPDYYPDIFKILKCNLTPSVVSYSVSGNQMFIDCIVYIKVLYLSENSNSINCIDQRYTYSKTIELVKGTTLPRVTIVPKADYCNCRAISGRRIDIRGAVSCKVKVCGILGTELLCGVKGMGTETRKNTVNYCENNLFSNRQYIVREDIETGAGGGIASIITVNCTASVTDTKVISDKVVVKGEAKVKSLYLIKTADGGTETESMEASIPLSQIIDVDGITDNHNCFASLEVMDCDLEIKQDENGDSRLLGCDITVDCKVSAYREAAVSPVCDVYSTCYDSDYTVVPVKIEHSPRLVSGQYGFKTVLECGESELSEVFDCRCDLQNCSVVTSDSNNVCVSGTAYIQIIGKNSSDVPVVVERSESFEIETDITADSDNYSFSPSVCVNNVTYSILAENRLDIRATVTINGLFRKISTVNVVDEIVINSEKKKEKNTGFALKLYYAESGENVWDIAKHYNTAVSAVIAENELENEFVSEACMLLIPIV